MWFLGWKGESGFSASSTAEQVTQGIDGHGLTAIVTGATSGLGLETTRVLALRGVHVVMAVRNVESGTKVKETILKEIPSAKIDVMELDLCSMASVRKFASDYISSERPLNILMYNSYYAYGQSKLANILHAKELTRRFKEEGVEITANALHPGSIITNILRYHGYINAVANMVGKYLLKNVQQGAATQCYVALHPQVKGISGEYFMDSNKATPTHLANDSELAKKLWEFSVSLTNQK
ncbi:short-chain dehydrogenase TIC 32, chloroplastic isoform X9 [Arachis ipaensis]|uniref:short-chain dehydrogenase TIC 32, chloroplastic isoform X9 n=1 Tax=Arachis ipaensis TaxID=130454 RepID=UPI000A2B3DEC|nr:short-chain dehydrogenase TIC 32, chloroplastic isoform X9 [Arachis ipaensis]